MSITREGFAICGADGKTEEVSLSKGMCKDKPDMPMEYFEAHKSKPVIPVYVINETDENIRNLFKKVRNNIGKTN